MLKFNDDKGFTLIELMIVMVIIGILILLAAPKFLNYIQQARYTNIINDTKVVEDVVITHYAKYNELPKGSYEISNHELLELIMLENNSSYFKTGKIIIDDNGANSIDDAESIPATIGNKVKLNKEALNSKVFYYLPRFYTNKYTTTKLKGYFLASKDGLVIYTNKLPEGFGGDDDEPDSEWNEEGKIFNFGKYQYKTLEVGNENNISDRTNKFSCIRYAPNVRRGKVLDGIGNYTSFDTETGLNDKGSICVSEIGTNAFNMSPAKKIDLTNLADLKIINESAFISMHNLKEPVIIPENVESIENNAFSICMELEGLDLSRAKKLKHIGDNTFAHNYKLSGTLDLPDSLEYIGDDAFNYGLLTGDLIIPPNIKTIGNSAFRDNRLNSLNLDKVKGPTTIGNLSFNGNRNMKGSYDNSEGRITIKGDPFSGTSFKFNE